MTDIRTDAVSSSPESLTEREHEILGCLVGGLSNQEIGARLHLALRTVKWYNSQIYSKLGVANRKEAIEQAKVQGLLKTGLDTQEFAPRNNLPLQPTRFVGRQHELTTIADQFSDANIRLVTILAPGGMGKTRLALAAAEREVRHFRDGVFFLPLAALGSSDDIIPAIADNVGFSFYGSASPRQQLLDYFRERHILLVLDNFEHVLDGALLVAEILQTAAGLRILTTSRERLNLQGESVYTLRGLDFPDLQTLERIQEYDAVKLFVQSAHRVRSDFEIHPHDLDPLARICRLNAGMPLGIELAAGWVDVLSLQQIATEIQHGIDILQTEMRDVPERQRSIRASFNRTWERLTGAEQGVFMRLSIFRGGFTIQAAEAVAAAGVHDLRLLANKALVQVSADGRHDVHELLRQFGAEKLTASSEQPTIQAKHTTFFADFMQEQGGKISTRQQLDALDQIAADYENVRSAWNVLVDQQAFDELAKFFNGLRFFLNVRNRWQEGVELFETTANIVQSLPPSDASQLALARLWARLAWFYGYIGFSERGKATAEAAIRLLNQYGSPEDLIVAYRNLALISMLLKDGETQREMAEAAYQLALKLGSRSHEAYCLIQFSLAAIRLKDDIDVALRSAWETRAIFEDLGDQWGMMLSYISEAGSAFQVSDYEKARHILPQAKTVAQAFGTAYYTASIILYLGVVILHQGDYGQAWDLLSQSLRMFWDGGYTHFAHAPLIRMAQLLLQADKPESAVEILALTDRHPGYHGHGALFEISPDDFDTFRKQLETQLGSDRYVATWSRGTQQELSAVVAALLSNDMNSPDR